MKVTEKWAQGIAGAFFAVIGGTAFWMMRPLTGAASAAQADRLFPRAIGIGLFVFGILAAARDFRSVIPQVVAWRFRPLILVIGSVVAFAATIEHGGLLPAVFATVAISAFGSDRARLAHSLILALAVATVIALLFVGLLGQPMKLIGSWP